MTEDYPHRRRAALRVETGQVDSDDSLKKRAKAEFKGSSFWSANESFAWKRILEGKQANLAEFATMDARHISGAFLREILSTSPYKDLIPISGVHIVNAVFPDYVDLAHLRINHKLRLHECRFLEEINLEDAKISSWLSLIGSQSQKTLRLRGAVVDELELTGFNRHVETSTFRASMQGLSVRQHLIMRDGRFGGDVDLSFAEIGSSLDLSGARFDGVLDLSGAKINELRLGTAWKNATKWCSTSADLVLRGTTVATWRDGSPEGEASLPLGPRNCVAPWPETYRLENFEYTRLGGFLVGDKEVKSMEGRSAQHWITWAKNEASPSANTFEKLAQVLKANGEIEKGNDVRYAGRKRERQMATKWRKVLLYLIELTTGYGIGLRYFRVLIWIATFTLIGYAVLFSVPKITGLDGCIDRAIYSLDALIPILSLDSSFSDVKLDGYAQHYFWLQNALGWIFGTFLGAGLAGLTQKS